MLKLLVQSAVSNEPTIPIRWCVDQSTLEKLKKEKVEKPYLFLTVMRDKLEVRGMRALVPLDEAMRYLSFTSSGSYTLLGIIVWARDGKHENLFNALLHESNRVLERNYREGNYCEKFDLKPRDYIFGPCELGWIDDSQNSQARINIEILDGFFAKKPFDWKWVNLMFGTINEPRNQCDLRGRRLFAYSIQPSLILLWALSSGFLRLVSSFWCLVCGRRGINWKIVLPVWGTHVADIWGETRNSIYITNKNGELRLFWKWLQKVLFGIESWDAYQFRREQERKIKQELLKETQLNRFYKEELTDLTCCRVGENPPFEIDKLPPKRRTVRLYYQGLKAKVCKPFAK